MGVARCVLPGTDLPALVAAICMADRCPDFLTPPPDTSVATFGEELECREATPPEVVHEDMEAFARVEKERFGSLPPEKERLLEIYVSDPEGALKRLVDELRRYYDIALAPYWPRIQEHLEGDTLKRGQVLALGGVEALLSGLHPKASYSGSTLELDKTYETALGAGRASVLKSLHPAPHTTTELARRLHLNPAAVSAHLSRLKAAELVEPHRSGKRVYYRLSGAGESLLGIFETGATEPTHE